MALRMSRTGGVPDRCHFPHRRRQPGVADCVRERRQSAPRSRSHATTRIRVAAGAGRQSPSSAAATRRRASCSPSRVEHAASCLRDGATPSSNERCRWSKGSFRAAQFRPRLARTRSRRSCLYDDDPVRHAARVADVAYDGLVAFKENCRRRSETAAVGADCASVMSFVLLLVAARSCRRSCACRQRIGFAVAGRLYAFASSRRLVSAPQPVVRSSTRSRGTSSASRCPNSYPVMLRCRSCPPRRIAPLAPTARAYRLRRVRWIQLLPHHGYRCVGGRSSPDTPSDAPVVIVNEHLASGLWPNRSAIGEQC